MILIWPKEYEKYLEPVLGHWWNCHIDKTPPEIVKVFKDTNRQARQFTNGENVVKFV